MKSSAAMALLGCLSCKGGAIALPLKQALVFALAGRFHTLFPWDCWPVESSAQPEVPFNPFLRPCSTNLAQPLGWELLCVP